MLNVVLLVIDSLRARALGSAADLPRTPFLDRLARESVRFSRAYAAECWTLPAHCSMFTGLLPSQHGAHFQSMQYSRGRPTIAEVLTRAGYRTEVVTRNSIFDGQIAGITRGFQRNTTVLASGHGLNPLSLMLAFSKPRFRRQIMSSGFFNAAQRANRAFVGRFARATVPADRQALAHVLARMERLRRRREPFFLFCNLYDVHAPYAPVEASIFRPLRRPSSWAETLRMPFVLPQLGGHAYLRAGFHLSETNRRLLLARYHAAIELMDAKLADFYGAAHASGLLSDTLLIVTSDHGEAFGEHGLYLHDASVYDVHLRVPLLVQHPTRAPEVVADVVSTRDLFSLLQATAAGTSTANTLLDPQFRAARPIAIAEHFHYRDAYHTRPEFRGDLVAAIAGDQKIIVRRSGACAYDLARDPGEAEPEAIGLEDFARRCRAEGMPVRALSGALAHLRRFRGERVAGVGMAA